MRLTIKATQKNPLARTWKFRFRQTWISSLETFAINFDVPYAALEVKRYVADFYNIPPRFVTVWPGFAPAPKQEESALGSKIFKLPLKNLIEVSTSTSLELRGREALSSRPWTIGIWDRDERAEFEAKKQTIESGQDSYYRLV